MRISLRASLFVNKGGNYDRSHSGLVPHPADSLACTPLRRLPVFLSFEEEVDPTAEFTEKYDVLREVVDQGVGLQNQLSSILQAQSRMATYERQVRAFVASKRLESTPEGQEFLAQLENMNIQGLPELPQLTGPDSSGA